MALLKKVVICALLIIICMCIVVGCGSKSDDYNSKDVKTNYNNGITYEFTNGIYIIKGYDAEYMEYKPANVELLAAGELYFINPYFLGDFFINRTTEGGAWWANEYKDCIQFAFTVDNGEEGTAAGPTVNVVLDLKDNEIEEYNFIGFDSQPLKYEELIKMGSLLADVILGVENQ